MRVSRLGPVAALVGLVLTTALACSSKGEDGAGGGSSSGDGASSSGGSSSGDGASSSSSGSSGSSPTNGVKDGAETDVDCGGGAAPACADGKACLAGSDCASAVCTGGKCAAPTATDGVKNGGETDVDCGGSDAAVPRCAPTKACKVHADCGVAACREGVCAWAPSCRAKAGGGTCGAGEVGTPGATHEDCCVAIDVPRPAAQGGPFKLDKYLITAGRMRAFLEDVGYDVKGWVAAHRPAWWVGSGTSTWDDMLPTSKDDFVFKMTDGGSGCYVGATSAQSGAPAYFVPGADLARVVGGAPRAYTQDELDTKVMNCFRAPLFHALCAYDGGRLPSRDEWIAARTDAAGMVRPYPWGTNGAEADRVARASYNFDYAWPRAPGANDADKGGFLPAPGRFPLGAGPYGHADLLGGVENMGARVVGAGPGVTGDGWFQFSFQEAEQPSHPYGQQSVGFGSGAYRNHWAVGARCVKTK